MRLVSWIFIAHNKVEDCLESWRDIANILYTNIEKHGYTNIQIEITIKWKTAWKVGKILQIKILPQLFLSSYWEPLIHGTNKNAISKTKLKKFKHLNFLRRLTDPFVYR